MAYVGIDQSYSGFGLVIINASTGKHHDNLGRFDPKKHGTGVDRLLAIEEWVRNSLAGWDIDHLCMEGYANASKFGREAAGELGYAVKRYLRKDHPQRLYPTIVQPTSLKKFVTGKGNAKKNEMLLGVFKKWGVEYSNDNLADAFALAKVAEAISENTTDLPKYQQEVIQGLTLQTELPRR